MDRPPDAPPPAPPADADPADRDPLAYHDAGFIESDEGRPLRILAEYLRPLGVFRRRRIHDTVVFFGSARITEDGPLGEYYAGARELAHLVTTWSEGLESPAHRYLVCTGGGPGIMEAANRGAREAGGRTIGLNIGLPHEQRPNPFISPGLSFEFRYFFMRKLWFAYVARAIIVFPGGFGTLDELFEFLTLSQTGKIDPPVATLLFGKRYWNEIVDFDALVRHGTVSADDLKLLHFVDTPGEAMAVLRKRLRPQDEAEPAPAPALARSVTPEDECATCGPEKEEHR
jgi:uncharacterized protein (TIGR00730 family)